MIIYAHLNLCVTVDAVGHVVEESRYLYQEGGACSTIHNSEVKKKDGNVNASEKQVAFLSKYTEGIHKISLSGSISTHGRSLHFSFHLKIDNLSEYP